MTQGTNELLMGLASAAASVGGGLLFALAGYRGVGVVGVALSLLPLGLTVWWMRRGRGPQAAWSWPSSERHPSSSVVSGQQPQE
jgi:predicted MFS family arabinose efflux permease